VCFYWKQESVEGFSKKDLVLSFRCESSIDANLGRKSIKLLLPQKMLLRLLLSVLAFTVSIDQSQVSAFGVSPNTLALQNTINTVPAVLNGNTMTKNPQDSAIRGGALKQTRTAEPTPPTKRIRLTALDGIRFLLCTHIVLGHFLRYANPSAFWLKFFSQVNISVGAFFALSGYVTAYTSTEIGQRAASPRLTETPSQKWWLTKIMAYYPMHWLVLLLFSPMFIYSDVKYGGWAQAAVNGLLSATLTQAWFPMHGEVWNAPTWFLSSMTFSTAIMPFALPKIAGMDKRALRRSGGWLFLINLLPVLGYLHDHNVWGLVEGMTPPKMHPALAVFNAQRFHPVFNVAEIMMGAVACRLAMLDTLENKDKPIKTNWLSTAVPFAGLIGILTARGAGLVPDCSDLLVRSVVFTPLFLKFVMGSHRNTVNSVKDPLSKFLSNNTLVWLGGLAFPIYIVHGPLGQVFYKKLIATKLWGQVLKGPGYFGL
jgi:peptidoglycan/LPS O-acetylase OafA/YrhL